MTVVKKGNKLFDKKTGFPVYGTEHMWNCFVKDYLSSNPDAWVKSNGKIEIIYKLVNGKPIFVTDYTTYVAVLKRGNELYKKKIIAGSRITLLNGLGEIYAAVLDTNVKRFIPDWVEYKKTGVLTVMQNDTYPAIVWKKFCRIKNEKVYEFTPARGNNTNSKGFVQMFFKAIREDSFLTTRYVRLKNK